VLRHRDTAKGIANGTVVKLALTPDTRWKHGTAELAAAAGAAGFSALGINADRVEPAAVEAYTAAGLRCHEVLALVVGDDERATVAAAERLAADAASMSADWVLTVFATNPTSRVIAKCARIFDDAGAGMAVEFSPLGPVATLTDAMPVVRAGQDGGRCGVMIDSWHFCVGASTWRDLHTVPLDDIAYVQFADALEPESQRLVRETMHRRALPGDGGLDVGRFAATLLDRGWDGVVSVEVLSAPLRTLPVGTLTRRLYDSSAPFWH
jgi:sugar phosphate isomerase/epimerase